jgi:hypothetical protein
MLDAQSGGATMVVKNTATSCVQARTTACATVLLRAWGYILYIYMYAKFSSMVLNLVLTGSTIFKKYSIILY